MNDDFRRVTEQVAREGRGLPVIELAPALAQRLRSIWPGLSLDGTPWHVLTAHGPVVLRTPHAEGCACSVCAGVGGYGEVWIWTHENSWAYRAGPTRSPAISDSPKRRTPDRSQVRELSAKPSAKPTPTEPKTLPPGVPRRRLGQRVFEVTIFYEEPLYARRRGIECKTYRGTFLVDAVSEADAVAKARALFNEAALESSVSWPREIVRTECRAA